MRATGGRPGVHLGRQSWRLLAIPAGVVLVAALALTVVPPAGPGASPSPSGLAEATTSPSTSDDLEDWSDEPSDGPTPSPATTPSPGEWAKLQLAPLARVATFEPTRTAAAGALPGTSFRLTSLDGSDAAMLASHLVSEPALDLRVTRADAGTAVVKPAAPLRLGQAYRVSLVDDSGLVRASWAVQTVGPLDVVGTIPRHEATGVPRDTGIEITFDQDGVRLADARPYITIKPAIAGTWAQEGRSIAFAPSKDLRRATVYTVTVRHGLPLHGTAMTLERDVTFAFETGGGTRVRSFVQFSTALFETRPTAGAVLAIQAEGSGTGGMRSVPIRAWRLPDMDAAVRAWDAIERAPDWVQRSGTAPVSTTGLRRVIDARIAVHRFDPENEWSRWLRLPRLAAGFYLVQLTWQGVPRQAVLQVTDVAVYTVATVSRTIAWANDLATAGPIEGAKVSLLGTSLGRTDEAGIAVGRTPASMLDRTESPGPAVVRVRDGSRAAFAPLDGRYLCRECAHAPEVHSDWWTVFQSDRTTYRSDDTLNAWGVVRARDGGTPPSSVEVRFLADTDTDDQPPVAHATASPDATGTFAVQLALDAVPYGAYRLELRSADALISDRQVWVAPILKPAWAIDATTDRHAYIAGDRIRVSADAAFFEGTPMAGATLRAGLEEDDATLTTDIDGSGTATLRAALVDEYGQWDMGYVGVAAANPEEGDISATVPIAIFRAGVLVKVGATLRDGRLVITGSVHETALDRYDHADVSRLHEVDPYGAARPGGTVRVEVTEHRFTRIRTGSRYDFITKRTVPVYTSEETSSEVTAKTVTVDSEGRFRLTLDVTTKDRTFEIAATAKDEAGRRTTAQTWPDESASEEAETGTWIQPAAGSPEAWGVGETVRVAFKGGTGHTSASRYLWTVSQQGLQSWRLTTRPSLAVAFTERSIPNIEITGVRFTGETYEVASTPFTAPFRATERAVDVAVTADRKRYQPGGRATLTVRTRDASGAAVPATVFIRVVDEKLYAMELAFDEDPLSELYGWVSGGILGIGRTHPRPVEDSGDGWGDTTGGGTDVRSDFRDWLVATLVRTDATGTATLPVDLSDDLTSWHATASAVTGDMHAGMDAILLPVGLPFFAEVTMAPTYLAADRPVIAVRGYGSGLAGDDTITFRVSSDTLPMATTTVTARAFRPAEVPLPKLTVGTHRVTVEAVAGSGSDARRDSLVRTFTVLAARQVQAATTSVPLTGATPLEASSGMTTLVLSDAGRGRVVPALSELAWGDTLRADTTLAAALAGRTLREDLGLPADMLEAQQGEVSRFQYGGVAVVPYASPDLVLTVMAALAHDPRLNADELRSWFADGVSAKTRERRIWVLAGEAATGMQVLGDIRSVATAPDLTKRERVALAVAAWATGDESLATTTYRDVLRDAGQQQGPWIRVSAKEDNTAAVLTARLAIVAAAVGDPVAAGMDAYVAANPPTDTTLDLERAIAATAWVDRVPPADASAFLTVDGSRRRVSISASAPVVIALTPAQAKTALLEPDTGSVLVTTEVTRRLSTSSIEHPAGQSVTRTVSPAARIGATDVVAVTYTVTPGGRESEGCWILTDMVPSGLVPISRFGREDEDDVEESDTGADGRPPTGPVDVVGQRVTFCATHDPKYPTRRYRYLARVVTAGTYRWEPAVLQSALDPLRGTVVPATKVTIEGLTE